MKENQICYFIENDMVIFGAYSYKSTCTHVVKRLRTPEVRLINGIPFDEFESEIEFKKLPKDWTYNTRLWEESIDQWKYEKYVAEFGTVNVKDTKRIQELFDNGLLVIAPIVDKFIEAEIDHGFHRIVKKAHGYPLGYGEHNDYYPDDVFDTYEECEKHLKIQRENRYKNHIYCRLLDVYENIDWALEKYEADHGGREIEFIKQKLLSIPRIWEYMFRYYKGQILKGKREEKNEEWEVIA